MPRCPLPGGIDAHAALAKSARAEAEGVWRSFGGEALFEAGEETDEYRRHRDVFVERFVDERLRRAHHYDESGEAKIVGSPMGREALSSAEETQWFAGGGDGAEVVALDRLSDEVSRAEAQLIAKRSVPGRPQQELCHAGDEATSEDGWSWPIQPNIEEAVLGCKSTGAPALLMRRVVDSFCSEQQCRELCGYAIHAMDGLPAPGGRTALAVGPWLGEAGALVDDLIERARVRVGFDFRLVGGPPCFAGAALTRTLPKNGTTSAAHGGLGLVAGPKGARVASDAYAAVLYLGTQGEHFRGGGLGFLDADGSDRWVAPRRARLVLFTTGVENLHRVGCVTSGARFVLVMWFTRSAMHRASSSMPGSLEILLRGEATRLLPQRASKLEPNPQRNCLLPLPEVFDLVLDDNRSGELYESYDCVD